MRTHQELDARSLAMHKLMADKIRANPDLFGALQETLARWRSLVPAHSQPYLDAWQALIDQGMEECLRVATEDSEWATALRQSSPFANILTHKERFDFLKNWKPHEAKEP